VGGRRAAETPTVRLTGNEALVLDDIGTDLPGENTVLMLLGWMIFVLPFVVVLGGVGLVVFLVTRSDRRAQQTPPYVVHPPPAHQQRGPQQPLPPHVSRQRWNPPRP
jgi:hypothetical protein